MCDKCKMYSDFAKEYDEALREVMAFAKNHEEEVKKILDEGGIKLLMLKALKNDLSGDSLRIFGLVVHELGSMLVKAKMDPLRELLEGAKLVGVKVEDLGNDPLKKVGFDTLPLVSKKTREDN